MTTNLLNRTLAERLEGLMKERGLNNTQLGKLAKVASNTVANYRSMEEGFTAKGKPKSATLSAIQSIAGALGVHPLALLSPDPALETASQALTPVQEQLLKFFGVLPPDEQAQILNDAHRRAARVLGDRLLAEKFGVTGYAQDGALPPIYREFERRRQDRDHGDAQVASPISHHRRAGDKKEGAA